MKVIDNLSMRDLDASYSYADYLTWQFGQTVELIKGKIFPMSVPGMKHQKVSWELSFIVANHFRNHSCYAFAAPFDVRLIDKAKSAKANKEVFTVIQPDLCIICDRSKIDENGCVGAPDLMIEILSPGNSKKEMQLKKALCEENGVREYWVLDPIHELFFQYVLDDNNQFKVPTVFVQDDVFNAVIFPNLSIDLKEVFAPLYSESF